MLKLLMTLNTIYKNDERGATAIEYGLIAAGISLAIVGVVYTFGGELSNLFDGFSSALSGGADGDAGDGS